jgi:hypothetical protein
MTVKHNLVLARGADRPAWEYRMKHRLVTAFNVGFVCAPGLAFVEI